MDQNVTVLLKLQYSKTTIIVEKFMKIIIARFRLHFHRLNKFYQEIIYSLSRI